METVRNALLAVSLFLSQPAAAQQAETLRHLGERIEACELHNDQKCREDIGTRLTALEKTLGGVDVQTADITVLSPQASTVELCNANAELVNHSVDDISVIWALVQKLPLEKWPSSIRKMLQTVKSAAEHLDGQKFSSETEIVSYIAKKIADMKANPRKCGLWDLAKIKSATMLGITQRAQGASVPILKDLCRMMREGVTGSDASIRHEAQNAALAYLRIASRVPTLKAQKH